MHTLVLDIGYQPINAVPFTRAMRYVTKGKVEVLEEYAQPIHPDWHAPAVVRLMHWIRPYYRKVRFSRQNVLARDQWSCCYCGDRCSIRELTFDHVVPRSRGGRTTWKNIVTSCIACNTRKGSQTPAEAGMPLNTVPTRPSWRPVFNAVMQLHPQGLTAIPPEWRNYWTVELLP